MQKSTSIDSFCVEDELFFESYGPERSNTGGSPTLELDALEAPAPTAQQVAHFTRFRKPVAWVIAAMGTLSLVAVGQRAVNRSSASEVVAHTGSEMAVLTPAAAKTSAAVFTVHGSSAIPSGAEQTPIAPRAWTQLDESVIALSPTSSTPGGKRSLLAASATQASLVEDFTSALLSMCRNVAT